MDEYEFVRGDPVLLTLVTSAILVIVALWVFKAITEFWNAVECRVESNREHKARLKAIEEYRIQ